jgi:hypothetical protein
MKNAFPIRMALCKQKCQLIKAFRLIPAIILLVILSSINVWSQPLLVEDFSYANGTAITANGWTAHSTGANPITVANPSTISYPGYLSSGVGGEVSMMTSGEDDSHTFTQQTSGTLYFSFLANLSSATTTGDYFFHIGATSIGTNFRGRIFAKRDASSNLYFGIANSSTAVYSATTYSLNTTYLIVLKYDIVAGTTNDVSSIYINPPLNSPIPASGWLAATDASGTDLTNIGNVALRQGSASNAPALKLDGIRVSTTWSDIVGLAETAILTAVPSTLNGLSYVEGAGPSTSQSYQLSGQFLTGFPNNIAVTAPADFEVSTDNSNFFPSVNIPYTSATLAETPVYVRLISGLTLGYYLNENITNAGGGATTVNVTCNGGVVIPEPTDYPTNFAISVHGQLYLTLTWTDAAGTTPPTGYIIKGLVDAVNFVAPVDHVAEADGLLVKNVAQGVQTVTFTGLDPNTNYVFEIWPYTNSGLFIDYKTDGTVPLTYGWTEFMAFLATANGNWNSPTTWSISIPNGGGWTPATTEIPIYKTSDVYISDGFTVTYPTGYNSGKVNTLRVYQTGTFKANSSTGSCYLYVFGDIMVDGVIGGATDVLGLDIEGSMCSVYGSNSLVVSRISKYTTYSSTTNLVLVRPLTLTYSHATNPALWNQNPATTTFNIHMVDHAPVTISNANVDLNGCNFYLNYPSSVILKSVSGSGSFTSHVTIPSWTDDAHGWHLLSSPMASQSIDPAFTDAVPANYDFYAWDEVTGMWLSQKVGANNITTFSPGRGYLAAYQNTPDRTFVGQITTSDVTVNNLSMSGGTYSGWNLLGNPYNSSLKWNDGTIWMVPANIAATAKVWNEPTAAYVDIPAGSNIPAFNGFMVQVLSGAPASLTIPSAARVHDFLYIYKNITENLKLVAYDHTGNTAQECVIGSNDQATAQYDRDFDSRFLTGYAPQFYAIAGGEMLSTDILPELNTGSAIELGFVKNDKSEFSIGLAPDGAIPGLTVYLTDKKTGSETELKENTEYSFISNDGDDPGRFLLHFSPLGIEDPAMINPFQVYASDGKIFILSTQDDKADVNVTNLLGQVIIKGQAEGNCMTTINAGTLDNGIYLVNMMSKKGVISHKIVISR